MKICKKCGAIQSDNHILCIDCGELLGAPVSKEEEEKINTGVVNKINELHNNSDYFHVSKLNKVMVWLLLIGAVASFISFFLFQEAPLYPIAIINCFGMLLIALDLRFPRISWELYKLRYIMTFQNIEDLQPSDLLIIVRKYGAIAMLIWGYGFLLYLIISNIVS